MTGPREDLRRTLRELDRLLDSVGPVGSEERELLERVMREIHEKLERPAEARAPESESLPERLRDAAIRFESSHPVLAEPLNRLVDALVALGI